MGEYYKVFHDIVVEKNKLESRPKNISEKTWGLIRNMFDVNSTIELYVLTAQHQLNLWIKKKKRLRYLFQIISTQYVNGKTEFDNKIMIRYVQMDKWYEVFTL